MKKFLLAENGNLYKANMHCHTTVSDGCRTPEGIKEAYQKKGYSIVAYTDHNVLVTHNDLTDEKFLALNGLELDICDETKVAKCKKTCHLCFVAKDKNISESPYYRVGECLEKNENGDRWSVKLRLNKDDEYQDTPYTPEAINKIIKAVKDKGFYVTYNHPTWSKESYPEYMKYTGMDAMEMFNGSSFIEGYDEYNHRVYDDMLERGERLFCVGGDDNHTIHFDGRKCDEGIAFTVFKAEELTYEKIVEAMENGSFYSSEGPEIYDLTYDDGVVHIRCSSADSIKIGSQTRFFKAEYDEDGNGICEATFNVPSDCVYFRLTVTDKQGKHACTNAYFLRDLV